MSETDEARKAFSQALIRLAREMGVGSIACTFSLNGDKNWQREAWSASDTHIRWSEGRHAAKEAIHLSYETTAIVSEVVPSPIKEE